MNCCLLDRADTLSSLPTLFKTFLPPYFNRHKEDFGAGDAPSLGRIVYAGAGLEKEKGRVKLTSRLTREHDHGLQYSDLSLCAIIVSKISPCKTARISSDALVMGAD